MDGSLFLSIKPSVFSQSGAPQAGIDSIAACWIHSTKPTVRPGLARRHARDLADIRMLRVRSRDAAFDLIDFGSGNCYSARGMEIALQNPDFVFTSRERADLQAYVDSRRGLALACREELAVLPAWAALAKCSTWAELAQEAKRRESIA